MANITLTGTPSTWGIYDRANGWQWTRPYPDINIARINSASYIAAIYAFDIPQGVTVTACSIDVNITQTKYPGGAFVCEVYAAGNGIFGAELLGTLRYTAPSSTAAFSHKFNFTGLSAQPTELQFMIYSEEVGARATLKTHPLISATCSVPNLTVGVTPSQLYTGNDVTVTFANRIGETLSVELLYNTTLLYSTETTSDSLKVTCPASWFNVTGTSSNSMSVRVSASDGLGRTSNNATFTLKRAVGGSISPVAPRSTTLDGAGAINFSWMYSGDGTLTKTELQWSTDNAVWTDLKTVNGADTTWPAPAVKFPGGTIYWRGRATNSFGIVGDWSSGVSFTVAYYAISQVIPTDAPTSGIINAQQRRSFSVALQASGPVYSPFTIASATFYWRAGESGTWTEIAMTASGSDASVSIPAGTFPSGVIQWKAAATDNTGRTTETSEYTLTTLNADINAAPLSPINVVESGSSPIVFRWSYGSIDGSTQSKAELAFSSDGTTWGEPVTVPGSETSYSAAAGTLAGGTLYWRVRAYNSANNSGPWSQTVSFIVFAAPNVRGVAGTDRPFSTISWQVEDQLAYKIEIDSKLYGPFFGENVRNYSLPEPLPDGLHTVRVAAQNQYGLWSEWEEASVNIQNRPGAAVTIHLAPVPGSPVIVISGRLAPYITSQPRDVQSASVDVIMETGIISRGTTILLQWQVQMPNGNWLNVAGATTNRLTISPEQNSSTRFRLFIQSSVGNLYSREAMYTKIDPPMVTSPVVDGVFWPDTGYFLVYRDGSLIGKTYALRGNFTDRAALGTHEYYVLQVLQGGYYTKSNTITVTASVDEPMIAPLAGGDFIELELSENSSRSQRINRTREVAYTQYAGATFPEAEIGEHESLSVSGDVAYTHEQSAEAAAFEALLGKPVIYKTPGGECVVGILEGFQRRDPLFYKSYTFSIKQIDWMDFYDADSNLPI